MWKVRPPISEVLLVAILEDLKIDLNDSIDANCDKLIRKTYASINRVFFSKRNWPE